MPKVPTVYDVADRAGVSIATVSFTYRQPHKVRESTREAVLLAARDLGYVPSASARGLADGRTGALGLFSYDHMVDSPRHSVDVYGPDWEESVFNEDDANADLRLFPLYVDEVQRGVELECWRRGYALMIGGRSRVISERALTDIAGRVDGLAVFPGQVPTDVLGYVSRRIPVIVVSEPARSDAKMAGHVTVDDSGGIRRLAKHLIQDHGYRDLQFIGESEMPDIHARFAGFRSALRSAKLKVPAKPLDHSQAGVAVLADRDTRAVVGDLLRRDALPEAIMCANDLLALKVIDTLTEAGVSVPGRVAVTGFDGLATGRIASPALTTVRQPLEAMGAAVVDILIGRIKDPSRAPVSRQFPVRTILRQSCGCPPSNHSHPRSQPRAD